MLVSTIRFPYSIKNITISKKSAFKRRIVAKTEEFINRLRWFVFFRLAEQPANTPDRNTYGFKSLNKAPEIDELKQFEKDIWQFVAKIRFKSKKAMSAFQNELDGKVASIISDKNNKIIRSDKTSNLYKIHTDDYNTLMERAVQKDYKLAPDSLTDLINTKIEHFAELLGIEDRVKKIRPLTAFISIKDHKPAWEQTMPTRLINPANSDLCKKSKRILDSILSKLRQHHAHLNQFRSSDAVLEWFGRKNDKRYFLLTFDIESFYPSITKKVLTECLDWAEETVNLDDHDRDVIMAARSVVFPRPGMDEERR